MSEEEPLKDPASYITGYFDGVRDTLRFECRWCNRRIDWYSTYRQWLTGRPSGKKLKLQDRTTCPLSPDGGLHDPDLRRGTKNDI